jgi:hypothetical protein
MLLEVCRRALEDVLGEMELRPGSGPSYLTKDAVGAVAVGASIALVRSDATDVTALRGANPGSWDVDEWQNLLEGRLGPWVIGLVGAPRHLDLPYPCK